MNTKLTLKLDTEIIHQAKYFAKEHHSSLSRLVEEFLRSLTSDRKNKSSTPIVEELSGVITKKNLPNDDDKLAYLLEKYS